MATPFASPKQPARPAQLPGWLKVRPPSGATYEDLKATRTTRKLATVCEEAHCPNIGECWGGGTATFMLMGDTCTRGCRFCAVTTGNPEGWLDDHEPEKILQSVQEAGWRYVVLTSVNRDDLPDGGAWHFARTVQLLHQHLPELDVEVLIPDYLGQPLKTLVDGGPDVVAHNLETVRRLTPRVRDRRAGYDKSLWVLKQAKQLGAVTKSSLMLGLGETEAEIREALTDLKRAGVDIVTLGQYLRPSAKHLPVVRFVPPDEFKFWAQFAEHELGFAVCASGPLVRSSYKAAEVATTALLRGNNRQRRGTTTHAG